MIIRWFVALSTLLLTAPALPSQAADSSPEAQAIIRAAYGALERYAAWPTTEVRFELDGFDTFEAEWLGEVLYRDLATLPDGDLVDALRGSHDLLGVDSRFARYELSWRHQDGNVLC